MNERTRDRSTDSVPAHSHAPEPGPTRTPAPTGATPDVVEGPVILAQALEGDPRRTDRETFMRRLHEMATSTATEMLGERAIDCPYIEAWFARHAATDAETLERMVRRYAGLPGATTADEILAAIRARLRLGLAYWRNGEDLTGELELAGLRSTAAAAATGNAIASAIQGSELHAQQVVAELGHGTPVAPTSSAAAGDGVRIHTDATAARLAAQADAQAFTIGRDIVLAASAPRPGSLAGDLLLAHELAHVEQQRGGAGRGSGSPREAEADADAAAAAVAAGRLGLAATALGTARRAVRAPLSLQRCRSKSPEQREIESKEARLAELEKTAEAKRSFGEVGAALGESRATEHWLSVLKTGKGPRTGSESGEADLPKCNCTTYVVDMLEQTFTAMGRQKDWEKVREKALDYNAKGETGMNGIPIQRALEDVLGWKGIFWAPDPDYQHYMKKKRDTAGTVVTDDAGKPVWIPDWEHKSAWKKVKKKKTYYDVKVAHSVVNYAPEPGTYEDAPEPSTTTKDTSQLDKLKKIPFGVLTARGARHMALLIYGVVYEIHWDQTSNSASLYQATPLEDWGWDSGVVVAPAEDVAKAFGT